MQINASEWKRLKIKPLSWTKIKPIDIYTECIQITKYEGLLKLIYKSRFWNEPLVFKLISDQSSFFVKIKKVPEKNQNQWIRLSGPRCSRAQSESHFL